MRPRPLPASGAVAAVLASVLAALPAGAVEGVLSAAPGHEAPSRASLVAVPAADGDGLWLAVRIELDPGWHTYWRNPGDSGAPGRVAWTVPPGGRVGPLAWPAPAVFREGEIVTYGYETEAWLPVRAQIPPGEGAAVGAEVEWLVCREICIPQHATLTLSLADADTAAGAAAGALGAVIAALPADAGGPVSAAVEAQSIRLHVGGVTVDDAGAADIRFFPHDFGIVDHGAPQAVETVGDGLRLTLRRDLSAGLEPQRLDGVLVVRTGGPVRSYTISTPLTPPGDG